MSYIFFDLETTGVDVSKDRICELSAIKTDLNLKILEKKTVLINPCVTIPEEATKIHGISNEMVKDKPTFSQYSKALYSYFQGSILAGYNIKRFDIPLLVEEFLRCGLDLQISEVIDCYEIVIKREKRDLTWALKFYSGEKMSDAHKAENDVLATIKILDGQKFYYCFELEEESTGKKPYISTFETMDYAGKIDSEGKFTFGQHKGLKVNHNQETIKYAGWMLKPEQSFTLNTKNVIKKILENK